jgi:hypothetical protein
MEDKSILEGGTRAVLFIMLSFGNSAEVPDFLTHRVTGAYSRSNGEKVLLQGQGARVSILKKAPLMIGLLSGPEFGWPGIALVMVPWVTGFRCRHGTAG